MRRLATPPTRLLGREPEIAALVTLFEEGARLVTLTGLGGVGKSRLALATAHALAPSMPVAHVSALAAKSEAELAVSIAEACELQLDARKEERAALVAQLATLPPHLIVLDDFEHLAPRATAMLEHLLAYAPTSFLVTSRVALDRPSEVVVPVRPLPLADAVALLQARARHAPSWRSDEAVTELARRLDGMPLALELAAGRARVVSPRELLALLDTVSLDRPVSDPRSARDAAVRWSWNALDATAKDALAGLALIGVFDLDGATAALGRSRAETLQALEALERVSLLLATPSPDGTRFHVLETVRAFVAQQVPADVRERAWERFADALVHSVSAPLDPATRWPDAARVMEQREHYLACARHALATPTATNIERALRAAAAALPAFLRAHLPLPVGQPFIDVLQHAAASAAPAPLRLRVGIAAMLFTLSKHGGRAVAQAIDALLPPLSSDEEDQRLRLELGIRRGWDGLITWNVGPVDEQWTRLAQTLGDESSYLRAVSYEVVARRALGLAKLGVDDRRLDEAARPAEREGWHDHIVTYHVNAAFLAHSLGDVDSALRHIASGLALEPNEPWLLRERARAEHGRGQLAAAASDFATACDVFGTINFEPVLVETTLESAALALERGDHELARTTLSSIAPRLHSRFERHYHHALSTALARLAGSEAPPPIALATTGTVEDAGFATWRALGADAPASVRAAAPHSGRVRQALRVSDALRSGVLVALDDQSFRVEGTWIELDAKPALRLIWRALVVARMDAVGRGVDKATLGGLLWPGERLKPEARDNRLQVNITTLRKLGLGDLVEAHDGGYRLATRALILRVNAAAH